MSLTKTTIALACLTGILLGLGYMALLIYVLIP